MHIQALSDLSPDQLASHDLELEAVCGTPCPGNCQVCYQIHNLIPIVNIIYVVFIIK